MMPTRLGRHGSRAARPARGVTRWRGLMDRVASWQTQPHKPQPDMRGFAATYARAGGNPAHVMKCFSPERLPTIRALAKNYLVCDNWFASVPGPTNPNRAFAHFGTSFGRVDSSADWFGQGKSIYERMTDAGADAKIYYFSQSSGTIGMTFLSSDYFGWFQDFKDDV